MSKKVITLINNDNHEVTEKMGFSFSILFTGPIEMFKNLDIVRGILMIVLYALIIFAFTLEEWYWIVGLIIFINLVSASTYRKNRINNLVLSQGYLPKSDEDKKLLKIMNINTNTNHI